MIRLIHKIIRKYFTGRSLFVTALMIIVIIGIFSPVSKVEAVPCRLDPDTRLPYPDGCTPVDAPSPYAPGCVGLTPGTAAWRNCDRLQNSSIYGPQTRTTLPSCILDDGDNPTNTPCEMNGVEVNVDSTTGAVTNSNIGPSTPAPKAGDCSFGLWEDFSVWDCAGYLLAQVVFLVMSIAAFVLWISGTILNYVLDYTIVDMSENIDGIDGINIAWKITRDLMNIAFIFLLIYHGIKMIIGLSDIGKVRSFVSFIVLASLLINFSLFFTKVMIDASNVVTIGLYNSIIDSSNVPKISATGVVDKAGEGSISGLSIPFMNALGLSNFLSSATFEEISKNVGGGTNMLIFFLMGTVVFTITSFAFFAVSILFIVRYITLIVLLMLSPIAYVGMALPEFKGYSTKWWTALNSQLIFAPVYMFMTLIVLTLMQSENFLSKGNWGKIVSVGDQSSLGLIFNFVIIIGLIIFSITIAKSTSTEGSTYIKDATNNLSKYAGGAVMGSTAWAGRRTVGRVASRLERSEKFQELAGKSTVMRQLYKGTRATAGGTFDARNTSTVKKLSGAVGLDLDKGSDNTFVKTMEAQTKSKIDFGKSLDRSKSGREAYIKGLAGHSGLLSPLYIKGGSNNSLRSLGGTLGRDDRMAAASLLKDRIKEASSELSALRAEENALSKAEAAATTIPPTGPALTPTETARLIQLKAPVTTSGSLLEKDAEISSLKTQATTLELDKTQRQKY